MNLDLSIPAGMYHAIQGTIGGIRRIVAEYYLGGVNSSWRLGLTQLLKVPAFNNILQSGRLRKPLGRQRVAEILLNNLLALPMPR